MSIAVDASTSLQYNPFSLHDCSSRGLKKVSFFLTTYELQCMISFRSGSGDGGSHTSCCRCHCGARWWSYHCGK